MSETDVEAHVEARGTRTRTRTPRGDAPVPPFRSCCTWASCHVKHADQGKRPDVLAVSLVSPLHVARHVRSGLIPPLVLSIPFVPLPPYARRVATMRALVHPASQPTLGNGVTTPWCYATPDPMKERPVLFRSRSARTLDQRLRLPDYRCRIVTARVGSGAASRPADLITASSCPILGGRSCSPLMTRPRGSSARSNLRAPPEPYI
jgi:hypothetical protein